MNTWLIASYWCQTDNSTTKAYNYLQHANVNKRQLKVFETILDIIENQQFILQNYTNLKLVTEGDISSKIWVPLFDRFLIQVNNNLVRLKTRESIFNYSQELKQQLYPNSNNVKAFKVDCRFLFDKDGVEYDVRAGEVAKYINDADKILHDEAKLLREGKDCQDSMLKVVHKEEQDAIYCAG